jgi:hypothetical protein
MKKQEFFNLYLPKWPGLLVVGKPVTREQAMEIIIRTDSLWFSTNDYKFSKECYTSSAYKKLQHDMFMPAYLIHFFWTATNSGEL